MGAVLGQRNYGVRVVRGLHLGEGLEDVSLDLVLYLSMS